MSIVARTLPALAFAAVLFGACRRSAPEIAADEARPDARPAPVDDSVVVYRRVLGEALGKGDAEAIVLDHSAHLACGTSADILASIPTLSAELPQKLDAAEVSILPRELSAERPLRLVDDERFRDANGVGVIVSPVTFDAAHRDALVIVQTSPGASSLFHVVRAKDGWRLQEIMPCPKPRPRPKLGG